MAKKDIPAGAPDPSDVPIGRITGLPDVPGSGAPIVIKDPSDSAAPRPKVLGATAGAALATIILWGFSLAGVDVPTLVVGAFGTLGTFFGGYFTSDK